MERLDGERQLLVAGVDDSVRGYNYDTGLLRRIDWEYGEDVNEAGGAEVRWGCYEAFG